MTPISAALPAADPPSRPAPPPAEQPAEERGFWDRLWGKEGFSFGALLDVINPLQHIPVVSTIYRAATGDTIGPAPRIVGGALFGGVIGLIASAADSAVEAITGKDTGSHVMAMLPDPEPGSTSTMLASFDDRFGQGPGTLINQPVASTMLAAAPEAIVPASEPAATAKTAVAAQPTMATAESMPAAPAANAVEDHATAAVSAAHPLNSPTRTAQFGAGGRQVPLANQGRAGVMPASLPSPQSVAADPSLLRDLRQGGAAAAQSSSNGRIDTAIKGHGLLQPAGASRTGAAGSGPVAAASPLDLALGDPQTLAFDAESRSKDKATNGRRDEAAVPEVGPDFLMKMQQALDRYQAMRAAPAPSVDVSR